MTIKGKNGAANGMEKIQVQSLLEDFDDEIKPEDLAPDGGWGWMVAIAMILVLVTSFGPCASFAIIFGDFLEATEQAGTATTLCNSVFMITYSLAGLLTDTLLKKFSMRPVGIVGAMFFSFPNVALAFVQNVYEMAFIYFLQGIGLGLIITICNTNFNAYFVKKRARVMSAAQVIIGLGGIVYPICIEKMMKVYGFRGTAAMTGALSLNCIVGMTMMHPVEWHAKKPEEIRAERARDREKDEEHLITLSKRRSTLDFVHFPSETRWSSLRSLKEESGKDLPLLVETFKGNKHRVASIAEFEAMRRGRTKSISTREHLTRKMSTLSASSLANLTSVGAFGDIRQLQMEKNREIQSELGAKPSAKEEGNEQQGFMAPLTELVEMSLLKNRRFLNICFGISLVFTSDFTFSAFLPLMMTNAGYTKSDAALAVMVSATAELVSRILLAIYSLFVDVKAKYLFFGAMICMAFAKIGFLLYDGTLTGLLSTIAVIGMVRSWLLVPQPLAIIEDVSIDKFAAAYGIFAVINGIVTIVFGPIVGLIKDWTNSFAVCQLALLTMNVIFVVPWTIQFLLPVLSKRKNRRTDGSVNRISDSYSLDQ